jgi:hypothetical protein
MRRTVPAGYAAGTDLLPVPASASPVMRAATAQ